MCGYGYEMRLHPYLVEHECLKNYKVKQAGCVFNWFEWVFVKVYYVNYVVQCTFVQFLFYVDCLVMI